MCFDFHTHTPGKQALLSVSQRPAGDRLWSLQVHPWHLPEKYSPLPEKFFDELPFACALGEIGLDRLRGPELAVQRSFFKDLLGAAERADKPVIIHSVRCDAELDAVLNDFPGRVLIHGFRGGEKRLLQHLASGRFVSFAPGGWRHCMELLQKRGLKNIGLETDDLPISIEDVYKQAETETQISDWKSACADNFLRFIG